MEKTKLFFHVSGVIGLINLDCIGNVSNELLNLHSDYLKKKIL